MYDLRCMSFLGKDNSEILVAGCQNTMFKIDVEKGRVLEEVDCAMFALRSANINERFLQTRTIL